MHCIGGHAGVGVGVRTPDSCPSSEESHTEQRGCVPDDVTPTKNEKQTSVTRLDNTEEGCHCQLCIDSDTPSNSVECLHIW